MNREIAVSLESSLSHKRRRAAGLRLAREAGMMLASVLVSTAWASAKPLALATRFAALTRGFRHVPPRCMPEGPECRVHAERLHLRFTGATVQRVAILSGRYAGSAAGGHCPLHLDVSRTASARHRRCRGAVAACAEHHHRRRFPWQYQQCRQQRCPHPHPGASWRGPTA